MQTRRVLIMAAFVTVLTSTIAAASLYSWNRAKRPPVSLAEALIKAKTLLGDDAKNRYCVSVVLYGDETRQGKEGAWNMLYAAADGSKKLVFVDMQGDGHVAWSKGPIDWKQHKGRRTDLADVRRRLEALFARQDVKAEFIEKDGRLLVKYRVREFQIYPQRDDGSYAEKLETVPGPQGDGIWLQVRIVDKPDLREFGYSDGIYWQWHRGTYFLQKAESYFAVDMRYGPKFDYDFAHEVLKIFGEETPNDFDPFP